MKSFARKTSIIIVCFLLILCGNTPKTVSASNNNVIINGVIEWKNIENLDKTAGTSATDWYVIALGDYMPTGFFNAYQVAVKTNIENLASDGFDNDKINDLQRLFLALTASGGDASDYIFLARIYSNEKNKVEDRTINELIFGLILADKTNYTFPGEVKISNFIEAIVSLQKDDGGFTLSGTRSDPDMTAMAIQALSPYVNENPMAKKSVDKALDTLSLMQKDTGDFSSFGVRNAESTAQVLLALCKMKIDYTKDSRFIKQGNTVYDGLMLYKNEDGSFSHLLGGNGNDIACAQTLCALVELEKMESSNIITSSPTPTFLETPTVTSTPQVTSTSSISVTVSPDETAPPVVPEASMQPSLTSGQMENNNSSVSFIIKLCLVSFAIVSVAVYILLRIKKHGLKSKSVKVDFIICIVFLVAWSFFVSSLNIKTPKQYYAAQSTKQETKQINVTINIDCSTIYNNMANLDVALKESGLLPEDGKIMPITISRVSEGSSVFDVLQKVTKEGKIQLEYKGGLTDSVYIKGINYLYEFSCGPLSGWMYRVNGEFASVSCSDFIINDGDEIEIVYSCDLGRDVGQNFLGEDINS